MARDRSLRKRNAFLDMEGCVKNWRQHGGNSKDYTETYKKLIMRQKLKKERILFFQADNQIYIAVKAGQGKAITKFDSANSWLSDGSIGDLAQRADW